MRCEDLPFLALPGRLGAGPAGTLDACRAEEGRLFLPAGSCVRSDGPARMIFCLMILRLRAISSLKRFVSTVARDDFAEEKAVSWTHLPDTLASSGAKDDIFETLWRKLGLVPIVHGLHPQFGRTFSRKVRSLGHTEGRRHRGQARSLAKSRVRHFLISSAQLTISTVLPNRPRRKNNATEEGSERNEVFL